MDLTEAILHAKAGNAVAFLGAGFPTGSRSAAGPLLTGSGLQRLICKELGIPHNTALIQAAQIYEDEKGSVALKSLVEHNFVVQTVSIEHKSISSVPWRRIYTTNYDDCYEVSSREIGSKLHSATLADQPDSLPRAIRAIVHLHGSVQALRSQDIKANVQLTLQSYLESQFPKSNWLPVFRNDINFASSVFFIGYSLNDLDISRVIFDPIISQKTFIITDPNTTDVERRRLEKFGTPILMEVCQFAELVEKTELVETFEKNRPLLCFLEARFPEKIVRPNQDAYLDLLARGTFDSRAYAYQMDEPNSTYATPRWANELIRGRPQPRILVHSNIGNGKTTFLEQSALAHMKDGFRVYNFMRRMGSISSEIDYILSERHQRVCLIFDGVNLAKEAIQYASSRLAPSDRMIVSCRTISYEIDKDEIHTLIGKDFLEIDLNVLSPQEIAHIEQAFTQYGVWGKDSQLSTERRRELIRDKCNREIRSVVLRSFSEGIVADKIEEWFKNARSSGPQAQRLILGVILAAIGHAELTLLDLCDLLETDYVSARRELQHSGAIDILAIRGIYAEVRSAVLAEHMARNTFDPVVTLDTMTTLITNIGKWLHSGDQYRDFMREIMRFAVIGRIFGGDRRDFIVQFYENVRNLEFCRNNPAFWLQYAMARMDRDEFDLAERMLATAEGRANAIRGYSLFQINNQKARLLFTSRARIDSKDYDRVYIDCVRLVNSQFLDGQGKKDPYPLRIIPTHEEFVTRRFNELSPAVRKLIPQLVARFEQGLIAYSSVGGWTDETEWRASLRRTKDFLERQRET